MKHITLLLLLLVGCLLAGCTNWQEKLDSVSYGIDSLSPPMASHNVNLVVKGDKLVVEGRVASASDKARVLNLAYKEVGMQNVIDQLQVMPIKTSLATHTSTVEEQRILDRVAGIVPKGGYNLSVIRADNSILLKGSVTNQQINDQIVRVVQETAPGLIIHNELRQVAPLPDTLVLTRVKERLSEEMPEILSKLSLSVQNGVVTFSGNVNGHREIDRALATTIMVDGVRDVRSVVRING